MRSLNRRRSIVVLMSVLVSPPAIAAALAQGSRPEPVSRVIEYEPGEACAFPVRVEVTGREKVIFLPGDRLNIASPNLTVTFTNLDDPSLQHTQIITGPVRVKFLENGDARLVFTGIKFLEAFTPELPYLALVVGHLELTLDVNGNFVEGPTGPAKVVDVCEVIGG